MSAALLLLAKRGQVLSPWVLRIVNQMRTTLGWTPAQRNQFITRIKNRATAQVAAAND